MAECVLAWACAVAAIITRDPQWAIASALYSIAAYLWDEWKRRKENDDG